jgi:glycosyltransferase involved in cell wall biosynthesis
MRIAHFLPHYPVPGGTSKAVAGIANATASAGHDVEIWTYRTERPTFPAHGAIVRVFNPAGSRGWFPSPELREFIAAHARDFHLIGLHGMFNPLLPVMAWLLTRAGTRYIICPQDPYHPELMRKNALRKKAYWPLESYTFRHAAAVQLLSANHVRFLRDHGFTAPVIVVPNGFNPEEVPAEPLRPLRSEAVRVVYLGRAAMHMKGLDLLLHALVNVRASSRQPIMLDFVGPDWGDVPTLQEMTAQMGLRSTVRFLGPDFQSSPSEILSAYDLLVLPSRYEGFGFVALEAMINATPVIVTVETGIAEHVLAANAGWVVLPTVEGLAAGLNAAIKAANEWPELGKRGRAYALEHLRWDSIARRAAANYERIVQGTAQSGAVYS